MSRKTDAMKRMLVALGHGSAVTDYSGQTVVDVLKELAVVLQCAPSAADIRATKITGVLDYIADNYGSESKEPYKLALTTAEHATVVMKLNGKTVTAGDDKLYNGDKLKVTITPDEGYTASLTLNGEAFTSGDTFTVNGAAVTIIAAASLIKYDLARTVDDNVTVTVEKDGEAVSDGEDVLDHGDVLTITAAAEEGYSVKSLKVNGEDFTSGNTLTVAGDVAIVAEAEAAGD